ncbi:unnamed protein product [Urochloa humidicola]
MPLSPELHSQLPSFPLRTATTQGPAAGPVRWRRSAPRPRHPLEPSPARHMLGVAATKRMLFSNLWRTISEEKRELERLQKPMYNSVRRAAEVHRQIEGDW